MNNSQPKFLALDIGGTKIEVCTFNKDYNLVFSKKLATSDFSIGKIDFLDSIKKIVNENLKPTIKKIGVSFNCAIKDGIITYSSILGGAVNYPFVKEFHQQFDIPITLENDVNAMAIAESKMGKGKGVHSFVLINLGTGIKLAFVNEGKLITGFYHNAGEISQKKIIVSEFSYKTFKIDDFLSGKGITNIYRELSGIEMQSSKIFSVLSNNPFARQTIDIFTRYFVGLLKEISFFYNPERVILNGSLKKSADFFLPKVLSIYKQETPPIFHFKDMIISEIEHSACLGVVL